jgi:small-conductance mechanosensitive channel
MSKFSDLIKSSADLDPDQIEALSNVLSTYFSTFLYLFLTMFIWLAVKDLILGAVKGFLFYLFAGFKAHDIVYINDRRARITHIGWRSTHFYMFDKDTVLIYNNERLRNQSIEKELSNGQSRKTDQNEKESH